MRIRSNGACNSCAIAVNVCFFFQAEDGIRDRNVTGVQTCALPICTSQKIALNTLSSAIMVRLNKVYGNLMVDLQPTNAKLLRRAVSLTMRATGANEDTARAALGECNFQVKVAIVAILMKIDVREAQARLDAAQ